MNRFVPGCFPKDGTKGPFGIRFAQVRKSPVKGGTIVFPRTHWFARQDDASMQCIGFGDISLADLLILKQHLNKDECWMVIEAPLPRTPIDFGTHLELTLTADEAETLAEIVIVHGNILLVPHRHNRVDSRLGMLPSATVLPAHAIITRIGIRR